MVEVRQQCHVLVRELAVYRAPDSAVRYEAVRAAAAMEATGGVLTDAHHQGEITHTSSRVRALSIFLHARPGRHCILGA